jgi:hypothetical protein
MTAARTPVDFDGDGKTDYALIRIPHDFSTPPLEWHVLQSSGGSMFQQFGRLSWTATGDRAMPADYDGDGKCDFAIFRISSGPLTLFYLASQTNTIQSMELKGFSYPGMTQDFDGDGKADPAEAWLEVNNNMIWRIMESRTGTVRIVHFGTYGDVAIRGDYDGDGKADIAVYRSDIGTPANTFFILRSSDGTVQTQRFGNYQTDFVVSGDFDGDAMTDFAVWRGRATGAGTNGHWYWLESSTGAFRSLQFGISSITDFAAPGDYDGDGKTDQAIARYTPASPELPSGKLTFYVNRSTGGMTAVDWGTGYDMHLASFFVQ